MSWVELPPVELSPGDSPEHPLARWFGTKRRERAAQRRARPPRRRPRRAIITIVNDESVFLPIWLRYYSRFFAPRDIYVLDNETADGSTAGKGFVRIPVSHDALDNLWMVGRVQELQHELLERYDVVVVTDVDEIVAPAPALGTLGDYLDRFQEESVNCLGYEVIHMRDREPPLRLDRPLLAQRGHWFYNDTYDKPAVATVPLEWGPGFHIRADLHFELDPDLRLIHLHRLDYELCRERHRRRSRRGWAERDRREGWGAHQFITEEPAFERWFYDEINCAGRETTIEEIPAPWRSLL